MTSAVLRCTGTVTALAVLAALVVACGHARPPARPSRSPGPSRPGSDSPSPTPSTTKPTTPPAVTSWVYQLQGYPGGSLSVLARAKQPLAVIDLARDAHTDFFRADEIAALRASGKRVLAYFEIGSIENFRPEYHATTGDGGLVLNEWSDWPGEYFVRYWDPRWWQRTVQPRVDQALAAGFDGVYLDTPLAYEEIDLSRVPGETRSSLARKMVDLIVRISGYARAKRPGFLIFPQNSPELADQSGYLSAVDGIGMEELFFRATDERCTEDYCAENLAATRRLRDAGKTVLAVDYARRPANVAAACRRYRQERFAGYVTTRDLDTAGPACS